MKGVTTQPICYIPDCKRPVYADGLCGRHGERLRQIRATGADPGDMATFPTEAEASENRRIMSEGGYVALLSPETRAALFARSQQAPGRREGREG